MSPITTVCRASASLSLVAALFLTLFAVVVLPANPAAADGPNCGLCGSVGGAGNNPGSGTGNNPGPSNPGGPSGGGGGSGGGCTGFGCGGNTGAEAFGFSDSGRGFFPSQPPNRLGGSGPFTSDSRVIRYGGKCAGNDRWSIGGRSYSAPYIGWTWQYNAERIVAAGSVAGGSNGQVRVISGSYGCIKPPHYRDDLIACPISAKGTIRGPMLNGDGVPSKTYPQPVKKSSFERGGRTSPTLCEQSLRYAVNGNSVLVNYGQYELRLQLSMARCNIRTYTTRDQRTGRIPPREVLGCGPTYVAKTARAEAELICQDPEIHYYWSRGKYNYSLKDCDNGDKWSCGPTLTQRPTFAGVLGNKIIGVLDDGKARRASWANPRPTGNFRNMRDRASRLMYRDGSPFRVGASRNGATQPFLVEPKNQLWHGNWKGTAGGTTRTGFDLSFMAAGVSGSPWTARPEWRFTADFRFMVPKLVLDTETGQLTHTRTYIWKELTGTCIGQPVRLDVHRARNSTN